MSTTKKTRELTKSSAWHLFQVLKGRKTCKITLASFPHPLALAFVTSPCLNFSIFFSFYPFGEVWIIFPLWIHGNQKHCVPSWQLNKSAQICHACHHQQPWFVVVGIGFRVSADRNVPPHMASGFLVSVCFHCFLVARLAQRSWAALGSR